MICAISRATFDSFPVNSRYFTNISTFYLSRVMLLISLKIVKTRSLPATRRSPNDACVSSGHSFFGFSIAFSGILHKTPPHKGFVTITGTPASSAILCCFSFFVIKSRYG